MASRRDYLAADIENDQPVLRFIAIAITSLICLLLYSSTAKSQLFNRITAIAKVGLLLAVIIAGIVYASHKDHRYPDWTPPANTTTNWVQGLLTCLFSYHGWENATLVAGEIPRFKDLRNGFIGAVMIVSAAYITIAVTLCYAFPWSGPGETVPTNYMAIYFGNSERAKLVAAVLTALSAVGSMISVTYTCVRVKHCIGWSNILPWSSLWRLSSPVRIPWWRVTAILQPNLPGQLPQTFEIPRGTPQGGVVLSWLVTTFWLCLSAAFSYANAIKFTSNFLVYGHFFASAAVGYGFFMGAFEVSPYFRHDPDRRVPTPNWNSGVPWSLLFPQKHKWIGHILLGGLLFSISIVVIVCGLTYSDGRVYFYVIIGMLVLTTLYWFLWIYPPMANRTLGLFGLCVSQATHGIDDRRDSERTCDICPVYEDHPEAHRHAQDGYLTYNHIWVKDGSEMGRFIMNLIGGSSEPRYHAPGKKSGLAEHVLQGHVSARRSRDWEPA